MNISIISKLPQFGRLSWREYLPFIAFAGGFLWDAFTLGRRVQPADVIILLSYLLVAILVLLWLTTGKHAMLERLARIKDESGLLVRAPYLLLQFMFGSLLSALFILYFKSAGHFVAICWAVLLGLMMLLNEYLEAHYKKLGITWAIFSLCAILLCNFILPILTGSIASFWFYLSIAIGVLITYLTARFTGNTNNKPVWAVAALLILAHCADILPPVPMARINTIIGTDFSKDGQSYRIKSQPPSLWDWAAPYAKNIYLPHNTRVYCLSSIYAPRSLKARLVHRWEYHENGKWITANTVSFNMSGGRESGFRGYSYKDKWKYGKWRVSIETEDGRTISKDYFTLHAGKGAEGYITL